MNTTKLNDWLQLAASIGVVVSLVFVGFEIQQSRKIATADIFQQRTALLLQQLGLSIPADVAHRVRMKAMAEEVLTPDEDRLLYTLFAARLAYWENNHFQYQLGLLDEEQWQASLTSIKNQASSRPFQVHWPRERLQVRKSFADAVDAALQESRDR